MTLDPITVSLLRRAAEYVAAVDDPVHHLANERRHARKLLKDITRHLKGENGGKNQNAVALGHLGGKKGGKARAAALSPERRSEIARQAAQTRWARHRRKG